MPSTHFLTISQPTRQLYFNTREKAQIAEEIFSLRVEDLSFEGELRHPGGTEVEPQPQLFPCESFSQTLLKQSASKQITQSTAGHGELPQPSSALISTTMID